LYDAKAVDVLIDFFAAIGKVEAVEYLRQHRSELPPVGDSVEPPSTSPEAGG
jgi:hypothetical protein